MSLNTEDSDWRLTIFCMPSILQSLREEDTRLYTKDFTRTCLGDIVMLNGQRLPVSNDMVLSWCNAVLNPQYLTIVS